MFGKLVKAVKSIAVRDNSDRNSQVTPHINVGQPPMNYNQQPYNQEQQYYPDHSQQYQPGQYFDPELARQLYENEQYARSQLAAVYGQLENIRTSNMITDGIRRLRDQQQQEAIANGMPADYYQRLNEIYNSARQNLSENSGNNNSRKR